MAANGATRPGGPAIRAIDPWIPGNPRPGESRQLLSEAERAELASIASVVRYKKGDEIYAAGEPVAAIYNVISGVVKTYRPPDGGEHIMAFHYPEDVFGLSEEGRYFNSARAVTPVTAYMLPIAALRKRFSLNAELELHVIAKLCHELRQAQRHALLLAQRHALARLAMFLQLIEHVQSGDGQATEVYLPMDRSDVAQYVGLSLAAVSRGFRDLATRDIVRGRDRRHFKIVDRAAFEKLAAGD